MPSRRYHNKTRAGCIPCKRAHVKCDQKRPKCLKCSKTGRDCQYGPTKSSAAKSSNESEYNHGASTKSPSESKITFSDPLSAPDFDPFDLQLMHHYTTETYHSLSRPQEEKLSAMWQVAVPKEAFKQPFLLHSLLALSALHKISRKEAADQSAYLDAAIKHHNLSLSKSNSALVNFNKENLNAMFVFSATIVILALALPIYSTKQGLSDPPAELAQIIILLRGSVTIIMSDPNSVKSSDLAPLLRSGSFASTADLPEDTKYQFDLVKLKIMSGGYEEGVQSVYVRAVESLVQCFRNSIPVAEDTSVVLCWLALIPQDLTTLIVKKEPMAYVLLAHYAVLLHALRNIWWCKSWGVELFRFIRSKLDEDWQELIMWPQHKIGLDHL